MGALFQKKTASFFFFKFFLEFAFAAGFFAATSLFISRVGPYSLFYIYFGSSLLALALSFLFSKIIDRYSRRLVFISSFLILGTMVLIGWALVQLFPQWKPLYFAIRIFSYSILVLTGLEFWVLASLTFSHADSKKTFSHLVVVTILGEMAGGIFTGFASQWVGTANLLLIWGGILCVIPFFFIGFSFPRPETMGFSTGVIWGEVQAPGTGFRSRSFFSSRLIQLIFLFWVVYSFICYGTDYVFNSYAAQSLPDEDALTGFFGKVAAAASVAVLIYHLAIGPRLLRRVGPAHNLFLVAALMALPWILFSIHPSLVTIAIADGMIYYFSDHFSTGIQSTILTVFPERVKGRIRVLTEGFGRPLGSFLLFGVGAIFAFQVSMENMKYWMLAATSLFLLFPLFFRRPYARHLLNCLHSRDPSLVLNSVQALGESPQSEAIETMATLLKESKNMNLRRSVVEALEHFKNPEAMEKVLPILSNPQDPLHESAIEGLRHCPDFQGIYTLLGLLVSDKERETGLRQKAMRVLKDLMGKEAIAFLLTYLYDKNPMVQFEALRDLAEFRDRRLISIFLPFLKNPEPWVRAGACIALYPFARTREGVRELALAEVEALIGSEDPAVKLAGYEAAGQSHLFGYHERIREGLKSSDPPMVLGAGAALARLRDPAFAEPYMELLSGPDESLAIDAAKRILEFPNWSRRTLFARLDALPEGRRLRIRNRLEKTRLDFSKEFTPEGEEEPILSVQMHA